MSVSNTKAGRTATKENSSSIRGTLLQAKKESKFVRFAYINRNGEKVKNVTARVKDVVFGVAHFGVIQMSNSNAHPGYRPISLSNLRSVRILQRAPK